MPIKGLTDSVQAAFPRIGKLRKGSPAQRDQAGKLLKMGSDLDYFRFASERPEVVAAFREAYGDKPLLITVYLPYPDVERNFQCWKEKWTAGGMLHRCDGETMTIWLGKDGKYQRTPRPCEGGCDEVGRLSLIVPELLSAGFVGYVTLETHGLNDLLSIQASLMAAADARIGNPLGLRGIQWTLRRAKEKISTPAGEGKRARRDKWLVKLEPAADWVQLQLTAAHNATMALPGPSGQPLTVEARPQEIDIDTGEIFDGETQEGEENPQPGQAQPKSTPPPTPQPAPQPAPTNGKPPAGLDGAAVGQWRNWHDSLARQTTLEGLDAVEKGLAGAKGMIPGASFANLSAFAAARRKEIEQAAAAALAASTGDGQGKLV